MKRLPAREVWTWPVALAAVSVVGMVAALFPIEVGDPISWIALAVPVTVCVFALWPGSRETRDE